MKQLDNILENFPEGGFLIKEGLNDAIIGVSGKEGRIVYSIEKAIKIIMKDNDMSYDEAIDFFYFNVERSHMGEFTPIWVTEFK